MFVLFRSTGCRLSYCLFSALRRQFNRLYTCAYNPHIYKAAEHFLFSVFIFFFYFYTLPVWKLTCSQKDATPLLKYSPEVLSLLLYASI